MLPSPADRRAPTRHRSLDYPPREKKDFSWGVDAPLSRGPSTPNETPLPCLSPKRKRNFSWGGRCSHHSSSYHGRGSVLKHSHHVWHGAGLKSRHHVKVHMVRMVHMVHRVYFWEKVAYLTFKNRTKLRSAKILHWKSIKRVLPHLFIDAAIY